MEIYPSPGSGGTTSAWRCILHSPSRELLQDHLEECHDIEAQQLLRE